MLGAAWIAGKAVLPAIAASHNGTLVGLASRSHERAAAMLSRHPGARRFDSYAAVIESPDVDAVYIPLTNNLHRDWTLRALAAGKHVLCEKPLAMDAAEAAEMAAAATSAGRLLMEAFMYRFDPRVRQFVEAVRDPLYVQASFGFRLDDAENYRYEAILGGGALFDVGCYTVSIARWILGEPVAVLARAGMRNGVDLTASALLVFEGARTASVWSSFESPEEQAVTVVTGAEVLRMKWPFTPRARANEPYRLMVESFADSVLFGRPVAIPPEESIANMRVLDRIRAAFTAS